MGENRLFVATSPHIKKNISITRIMWIVVLSLVPAFIHTVYLFGMRTVWVTLTALLTAVASEALTQFMFRKKITVYDGSAVLTALLLVFNVPPQIELWKVSLGTIFAIVVVKQLFGGLGYNIFNPALAGRAFLMASYTSSMTTGWSAPRGGLLSISRDLFQSPAAAEAGKFIDAVTSATPLGALKSAKAALDNPALKETAVTAVNNLYSNATVEQAFWGKIGGCFGEITAAALLLGALVLLIFKIIDWRIPAGYLGTMAALTWAFGGIHGLFSGNPLFHLFTGGLILGAFYMATDMVTSPMTGKGKWIFAIALGVLTFTIRTWGGYPEGVSYSILLMNIFVPLIDKYTVPQVLGGVKR